MIKLKEFVEGYPALANAPAVKINGKIYSLKELLYAPPDIREEGLKKLGIDPPDEDELAYEFFKRLYLANPGIKIYSLGSLPPMSPAEMLEHIRKRDKIGLELIEMYKNNILKGILSAVGGK